MQPRDEIETLLCALWQVDSAVATAIVPLQQLIEAVRADIMTAAQQEARERSEHIRRLQAEHAEAIEAVQRAVGDEANAARQREQGVRREASAALDAALLRVTELENESATLKSSAVSEEQASTPQNELHRTCGGTKRGIDSPACERAPPVVRARQIVA